MPQIKSLQQKVIYIYQHIDVASHEGWFKVGETIRNAEGRVQAQNEADNVRAEILWTTEAIRNDGKTFSDKDIHRLLETKGVEREKKHNTNTSRDSEWFKIDIEKLKQYISDYKNCIVNNPVTGEIIDFTLRSEQQQAINVTKEYWRKCKTDASLQPEFLWNAKPRFGKTLTAYEFAKNIDAKRVLIITNRPTISDSWFTDFKKFIEPTTDFIFASSDSIVAKNKEILRREDIFQQQLQKRPLIFFISLQDLKGQGEYTYKDKNKWIFGKQAPWDLLIIDESHEGVDTYKSERMKNELTFTFALHLSGTPFKAIQSAKFNTSQIYNWSYADEQNAKANWDIFDGENPYEMLPKLNVFTYQLSRALALTAEQAKDEGSEFAFDLGEFFRIQSDVFAYENEVCKFLDNLCNSQFEYPFSKPEYLESLRHTFWLLPGVKECKQMENLLNKHHFFKDYKTVLAAGDWEKDKDIKTALEGVRSAIGDNPLETKTITLSCAQLTTGVTVPAWTAVLMLNNCKSPSLYMQSAFRPQNPFEFAGQMKTDCFVFDFAPDRILQTIAELADNMNANSKESREQKVKMLLNFLPVIAEDDEGRMHELDANEVLTIPLKLITQEVVNRGFMSNRLFENIAGIFGAPKSVLEILEKIKPEENKRLGDPKKNVPTKNVKIWLDTNKKIHIGEDIVVNTTNGLLGDKKYVVVGSDEEKEVQQILTDTKVEMAQKNVPQQAQQIILKELEKKMPAVFAQEPKSTEIEDLQFPEELDGKPTKSEKTEEEKVRDRLRGFTRTIPSFLMAYGNEKTTLTNFEQNIPDQTFIELTSITKEEFRKLRDGFEYEEEGKKGRFEGLFNCDVFNASIALFLNKKQELANYFESDGEDIFDYIPPQETNQIFTPKRVVKMIVDRLQETHPELFKNSETTFCDLYMKSGLFITEIVRRLFENTRTQYNNDKDCIRHILEKQVYGFAPTDILYNICMNLIFGFDTTNRHCGLDQQSSINRKNFCKIDTTPYCKQSTITSLIQEKNMKFDVIIGNPPYQGENHQQIYTDFYLAARQVGDYVCLIFPVGWQDPKNANNLSKLNKKKIKEDRQIVQIDNRQNCFPQVSGAEWTNIVLWQNGYDNGLNGYQKVLTNGENPQFVKLVTDKDDISKPDEIEKLVKIVMKVDGFEPMQNITSALKPYGLRTDFLNDPSKYDLPNVLAEKHNPTEIKIYGLKYRQQVQMYIPQNYPLPKKTIAFDKYKVLTGKAWGNFSDGYLGGAYSDIVIASPNEICTENFLESGIFNDFETAKKHAKYLMTQFARALLFFNKHTQDNSKDKWVSVPIQDYSEGWWSLSIAKINEKLFEKYGIPENIRKFVCNNIQVKDESNIVNFNLDNQK